MTMETTMQATVTTKKTITLQMQQQRVEERHQQGLI